MCWYIQKLKRQDYTVLFPSNMTDGIVGERYPKGGTSSHRIRVSGSPSGHYKQDWVAGEYQLSNSFRRSAWHHERLQGWSTSSYVTPQHLFTELESVQKKNIKEIARGQDQNNQSKWGAAAGGNAWSVRKISMYWLRSRISYFNIRYKLWNTNIFINIPYSNYFKLRDQTNNFCYWCKWWIVESHDQRLILDMNTLAHLLSYLANPVEIF